VNTTMTQPQPAEHVLVADDSLPIRRLVATRLRLAGFRVTEAADGSEALDRFREEPSAVVITDVGMPRLGGLDLLARLRCHSPAPEVILLTGTHADDAKVAVEALRLGAHDYINKDPQSLEAVVLAASRALDKFRLRQENARLLDRLRTQSLTDSLTGVGNRRAFDRALVRDVARARRERRGLALVMLDLDLFKKVNDRFGHRVGDDVLAQFTARLQAAVRATDELFRYGGEEFALLLPELSQSGGAVAAARCVEATAAQPFDAGRERLPITCSAGVAELEATDADSGVDLLARADAALYEAKHAGRNRLVVYRTGIDAHLAELRAC
jgi:two-component system, cell cycle response regulator